LRAEEGRATVEQRPLPLANLIGMDPKLAGQLLNGFLTFDGFQRNPKLELSRIPSAMFWHTTNPSWIKSPSDLITLTRGPVFGANYTV
jgi:hypothetical protein